MTSREALNALKAEDRKIVILSHSYAILSWDFETACPEKAAEERAEQLTLLSLMIHEKVTSDYVESLVSSITDESDFSDAEKALVREWRKTLVQEKAIPSELVARLSRLEAECHVKWLEAREKSDFSVFEPSLSAMIDAQKEKAGCIAPDKLPYDALLDLYEPGITVADLDPLFDSLEKSIHEIMDKTGEASASVDDSFLLAPYEEKALHEFCVEVVTRMGFDFTRGAIGLSAHPFTTTLGRDDVRITTRYTDEGLFDPIGSLVHEAGHALYEQNVSLNPEIRGTSLADGVSMGIHESQSRFWENFMGRRESFWSYWYPVIQDRIPTLKDVSFASFLKAVNKSMPSAIRVNADELTYSLHIILRYRLEKALFNGEIAVHDIPEYWNMMSKQILRYAPKNDAEGCLQDCHWSQGSFGYFPTYALGNVYAAMFLEQMICDLGGEENFERMISSGDYSRITGWQKEKIWYNGKVYMPKDLLRRVTGKELTLEPYVKYLSDKFEKLFC